MRDLETRFAPPIAHLPGKDKAMAVFAVIMPVLMLGVVLALGRYEEWLLPPARHPDEPETPALPH